MPRFTYVFIILFVSLSAAGQVVNIENSRMHSDTSGWMGSAGTSFTLIKNVQQITSINANVHVQYKTQKSLYLLLANYNLLRSRNQNLSNNLFYHLRYNYKINKVVRWEVFTQWQENSVTNIALRFLAGTGPRFKVHESTKLKLYAATAAMFEYEKEKTDPAVYHNDVRSSSYVSVTWQPAPLIQLTGTTFYQPLYKKPQDFRLLSQATINVQVTKRFALTTSWDYLYDAFPAAGAPSINYTISNGFTYSF